MMQPLESRVLLSVALSGSIVPDRSPVPTSPGVASASVFLSASSSDAAHGSAVTLVAHVVVSGAASAEGLLVQFVDQEGGGNKLLATVPIHNNTATITWTAGSAGDHQIQADLVTGQSMPSAQSAPEEVTVSAAATQTTLTVSRGAVTARVTSAAPDAVATGSISFFRKTRVIATIPVGADGTVTLPASLLHPGKHALVAAYNGSSQFSPSTSQKVVWTVSGAWHATAGGSTHGRGKGAFAPSASVWVDSLLLRVRQLRTGSAAIGRRGILPLARRLHP